MFSVHDHQVLIELYCNHALVDLKLMVLENAIKVENLKPNSEYMCSFHMYTLHTDNLILERVKGSASRVINYSIRTRIVYSLTRV